MRGGEHDTGKAIFFVMRLRIPFLSQLESLCIFEKLGEQDARGRKINVRFGFQIGRLRRWKVFICPCMFSARLALKQDSFLRDATRIKMNRLSHKIADLRTRMRKKIGLGKMHPEFHGTRFHPCEGHKVQLTSFSRVFFPPVTFSLFRILSALFSTFFRPMIAPEVYEL